MPAIFTVNRWGSGHSMVKRVTMKDVADAVGVHVSTVSRALDPTTSHRIRPEVAEKIRQACRDLGYSQTFPSPPVRTTPTRTVGVVVPDVAETFFSAIIRGAEQALVGHGYLVVIANTDRNERREAEIVDIMRARGLEGLILSGVEWQDNLVSRLAGEGLPVVTVNRRSDDARVSSVVYDEDDGFAQILAHLTSLGHRQIANIAGPQNLHIGQRRYRAFERHRQARGLDSHTVFSERTNEAEGERCGDALARSGRPFTAVVCGNDRLAFGAITALRRHGLECPRDVSVTGFNDMPLADRFVPSLTTVHLDQFRAGWDAAELLAEMLDPASGHRAVRHSLLPVELVIRESTGPAGTS
jgi:LacI family transcriptional regulator